MKRSKHSALHAQVAAMQIGDCLQWEVPDWCGPRTLSSTLSNWTTRKAKRLDFVLRAHFHNRRLFIVRIA